MGVDAQFGRVRGEKVTEIVLVSIESAPVRSGEAFGPCLLGPGSEAEWVIGHWDGHHWHDDDGTAVSPVVWALLPPLAEAIVTTRPATLASAIAILEQVSTDEDLIHRDAIRNVIAFLRDISEQPAPDRAET
jgi:hypothetical protein